MVDIARDARWGRIAEGAGEDPFLGAAMAAARVRGFQGDDYSRPDKVVACAKHWVAYGAAEAGRDYNTVDMSEHTLRSIYFPPFKAAVDAGVGTFMSAFNDLNGVPASGNHFTLTEVLRGEWKFDGMVVSDYNSVIELIKHGFAADEADAARLALTAGVDMEMISRSYVTHGPRIVKDRHGPAGGAWTRQCGECCASSCAPASSSGRMPTQSAKSATMLTPESRAAAREIAARSMVLLKNEGVLPLVHQPAPPRRHRSARRRSAEHDGQLDRRRQKRGRRHRARRYPRGGIRQKRRSCTLPASVSMSRR